ncbi:MAG: translation initiation factor IF-3 [Pseudomonadales bacterium]
MGEQVINQPVENKERGAANANKQRINDEIRAREVRLIGADGSQVGVVSLREALAAAEEAELDLVEISPDATPPVCKVMDYGKFLFEQKKQKAEQKKKQHRVQIKEIKFRPGTEDGDYQVKTTQPDAFPWKTGTKPKSRCVIAVVKWLTKSWAWRC